MTSSRARLGSGSLKVRDHGGAMDSVLAGQGFDGGTACSPVDERGDLGRIEPALDLPATMTDRRRVGPGHHHWQQRDRPDE